MTTGAALTIWRSRWDAVRGVPMRLSDPTHLYEGGLSERADRASRAVSVISHAPFLSAFMFVLLGLTSDDPIVAAATIVVSLLTATVIPVLVVQHYSVRYGNTDGDVARREDRARPLLGGILSYVAGVVLLYAVGAPDICTVMMLSYAISTAAVAEVLTARQLPLRQLIIMTGSKHREIHLRGRKTTGNHLSDLVMLVYPA